MRIHFRRTGGFAGMRLEVTVDSSELPGEEVERLRLLVRKAHFFELPDALEGAAPGADRFSYTLTVESGGRAHTVHASDAAIPDDMRPLLQWLQDAARTRR